MTPLEKLYKLEVDDDILNKPSQNHQRREYVNTHFYNKELLSYLIEDMGYSSNYISRNIFSKFNVNIGSGEITDKCKKHGITTRNASEAASLKSVRIQYENTCRERYGAENALAKNTNPYHKKNKTVKSLYGVDNVFQLDNVKIKSSETMMNKYGVTSAIHLPNYERNYGRRSKLQKTIEKILDENKIDYISEASNRFCKYNEILGKYYSPIVDILIEGKKIVIEINGDRWHANPNIYKSTDVINKWGGLITAEKIWEFDKIRNNQITSFGYEVIVLWQYDIQKNIKHIKDVLNEKVFKN